MYMGEVVYARCMGCGYDRRDLVGVVAWYRVLTAVVVVADTGVDAHVHAWVEREVCAI